MKYCKRGAVWKRRKYCYGGAGLHPWMGYIRGLCSVRSLVRANFSARRMPLSELPHWVFHGGMCWSYLSSVVLPFLPWFCMVPALWYWSPSIVLCAKGQRFAA